MTTFEYKFVNEYQKNLATFSSPKFGFDLSTHVNLIGNIDFENEEWTFSEGNFFSWSSQKNRIYFTCDNEFGSFEFEYTLGEEDLNELIKILKKFEQELTEQKLIEPKM